MSSSHLFFGLPIVLLVLYLELSSGFHSAAFLNHLSLGDVAILSANFHFIFLCVVPASNPCMFHLVNSFSCASSYVINPIFFFDLNRVNIFFRVFIKCHSTVQIIFRFCALTISAFIVSASIFSLVSNSFLIFMLHNMFFNFFVFSFRLDDEA